MPVNHIAEQYLHAFTSGGDFPGGLAFRKALGQANLDFTPDSLGRIDMLLRQMRTRLRPDYTPFINKQENQTFLYLLCFYVGAVVCRYTRDDFAWYSYDELKEAAPPEFLAQIPEAFATSMVCLLRENGVLLPLSPILDLLFDEAGDASVLATADKTMRRLAHAVRLERPQSAARARRPAYRGPARHRCLRRLGGGLRDLDDLRGRHPRYHPAAPAAQRQTPGRHAVRLPVRTGPRAARAHGRQCAGIGTGLQGCRRPAERSPGRHRARRA
ncbi:hypothetical protein [Massilia sp. Se16.2.3]|uniref:hypothetical protein n=1 Tax=Massilia sp. Se16.2.3 TaxID=2709303 RepID=UPI0016022CB9|nr:hypothetical protein [Massilia sp. Se16.2.3]QNB01118.1 hypothetical protein G4G31_23715 [Massilia sp. Se16.2.3]